MKSTKPFTIAIATCLALSAGLAYGQENVVTKSGRIATLHPNGTWTYVPAPMASGKGDSYKRADAASVKVDLGRTGYTFYFDPTKWTRKPDDDQGRTLFASTSGDLYAMIISERIPVELDQFVEIALSNAKDAAPDSKLVHSSARTVNGFPVRLATIEGKMGGINFAYHAYYFSGKGGSVQVVTYTGANLLDEYKPEMEDFLNGFVGGT